MKFGRNCEGFVGFGWFGMVWQRLCNECWKRLCNPEQSVSESVTKVGIELLGQLKKHTAVMKFSFFCLRPQPNVHFSV